MPRLRNIHTGAVMSVPEGTASNLGGEWKPAHAPEPVERAPRKARRAKAVTRDSGIDNAG